MTEVRAAPYPPDTRAKGWRFELDYEKIEQSDTWGLASGIPLAQHALLMMWFVAWRQVPCGSLPTDEQLIRAHCRLPEPVWRKVRDVLLRGWWHADDGRMYHDTLVQRAREMIEKRGSDASRKKLFDEKFYAIRTRDGGACVYCSATKYLSLDHLVAVSRGGSGNESNLVTACRSCNSRKGARTPDEAGLTFVNKVAERLWIAIKETSKNTVVMPTSRVTNEDKNTDHRPPETKKNKPPHPPAGGASAFDRFWNAWPKHERKVASGQCRAKWRTKGCEEIADQVIAAVEAAKLSEAWLKESGRFIPAPLVWLNQERWVAPLPEAVKPAETTAEYLERRKREAAAEAEEKARAQSPESIAARAEANARIKGVRLAA